MTTATIKSQAKSGALAIAAILCLSSQSSHALSFDCDEILISVTNRIVRFFNPLNIEQLRIEKERAKGAYEQATKLIEKTNGDAEINRLISLAYSEQRKYCDAHNKIISVTGGYSLVPLDAYFIGENFAKSH